MVSFQLCCCTGYVQGETAGGETNGDLYWKTEYARQEMRPRPQGEGTLVSQFLGKVMKWATKLLGLFRLRFQEQR